MNDEPIKCPKCNSIQIHVDKRGFKTGRAIAGGLLTGNILVAAAAGGIGHDKIELTCLKCGCKFGIKDIKNNVTSETYKPVNINYNSGEFNTVICSKCGGKTLSSHKYCSNCGKLLDNNDKRILSVSYTHLDVYKRQPPKLPKPLPPEFFPLYSIGIPVLVHHHEGWYRK